MKFLQTFSKGGLLALALMLAGNLVLAQRTVAGKVTDVETGEALIGANVSVVGTNRGATTNIDGMYSVVVPEGSNLLRFGYTGYDDKVVVLDASNTVDVQMKSGAVLNEVVVIGYGSVRKVDATGAVGTVTEKDFNRGLATSPEQLMQGKVAGVQITNNSGEPGGGINVRIRGTSSVRSGNNPLYVVDGVPLSGQNTSTGNVDIGYGSSSARNPLNFLNQADIETMDILKDASATAIYGSRGANGVILITTKKGKAGKGALSYDYSVGVSNITKKYDLLDRDGYLAAYAAINGAVAAAEVDHGANTDWQDEIFRTGISQNHNVSYSGGGVGGNFRVSAGYSDIQGILERSGQKKYTVNLSGTKGFLEDRLTMGSSFTLSKIHDDNSPVANNSGYQGDVMGSALKSNPTLAVRDSNGDYIQVGPDEPNPAAFLGLSKDFTSTLRALGNLSAELKITNHISFKTLIGLDESMSARKTALSRELQVATISGLGRMLTGNVQEDNRSWENYFTYNNNFHKVSLLGTLGYSYNQYDYGTQIYEYADFRTDDLDLMINNAASAKKSTVRNTSRSIDELQSYFGRVLIGINDRYNLTATLRADGSSKFGENNRYGYFPAFGFKWRAIEESFVPKVFSDLGIRLGWGINGNQEIAHNAYQKRVRYSDWDINDGATDLNGGGANEVSFANPDLKWETTKQMNFGIDFGFLNNRITGAIDFYKKNTNDLLLRVASAQPAPQPFVWRNLDADIQNTGVELSLDYTAIHKTNFKWNVKLNGAYNKNLVKRFSGLIQTGRINGQGLSEAYAQRIQEGQPLYAFFVRDFAGFDDNGISIYNGGDVQQPIGSPLPTITAGLTNEFNYGNWDLNFFFNSAMGHKVYNNTANAYFTKGSLAGGRNVTTDVPNNGESRLNAPDVSTRFLEDASFVRLQNLTLGYRFPIKNKYVSGLRLFVTGQNLALFTNYSGQDPEVNVDKSIDDVPSFGIDYTAYPRARTILLGGSISF